MAESTTPERFAQLQQKLDTTGLTDAEFAEYKAEADKYDRPYSAAALGAVSAATLGLSDVAAKATGFGEDVRRIREFSPTATTIGEVGGTVASAIGGPLSAIGKATERAVAKTILKEAAEETAKKAIGKGIVRGAIREGVEGAVVGAGQTVSDVALSNKEYSTENIAENLIANVGMGAIIGAPIGGVIGGISAGASRGLKSFIKKPSQESVEESVEKSIAESADEALPRVTGAADDTRYAGRGVLDEAIPERGDVNLAMQELGAAAEEADELIKRTDDNLYGYFSRQIEGGDTLAARKAGKLKSEFQNNALSKVKNELNVNEAIDNVDIGNDLKKFIKEDIEAQKSAFGQRFGQSAKEMQQVNINAGEMSQGMNALRRVDAMKLRKSPAKSLAEDFIEGFKNNEFKTVRQIDAEISQINGMARAAARSGNGDLARMYGQIQDALQNVKDKSLQRHVINITGGDTRAAREVLGEFRQIKKDYAQYAQDLREIGEFGGKKIKSPTQFVQWLDDIDPEKLGKKFLKSNLRNADTLNRIKNKFPNQFENMRRRYVLDLWESSVKDGELDIVKFVRDANKINPASMDAIFTPEGARTLRNLNTVRKFERQLLKTPRQSERSLQGVRETIGSELRDAVFYGITKALGVVDSTGATGSTKQLSKKGLLADPKIQRGVRKTESTIKKTIKQFLEGIKKGAAPATVKGTLGSREENKKTIDTYAKYAANPQIYMDKIMENTQGVYAYSPSLADSMMNTGVESVNFLISKLPKTEIGFDQEFYDEAPDYSDYQIATFNRYARAVENPLSILEDIQAGTLTPQAMEAVRTIYPTIMSEIQTQVMDQMSKNRPNLAYGQKVQLSMLLGFPVSATMKPSFIAAMQKGAYQTPQQQQSQPQRTRQVDTDIASNYETSMQSVEQMS